MREQESNNFYDLNESYAVGEDLVKLEVIVGNGHIAEHFISWWKDEDEENEFQNNFEVEVGLGSAIKSKSLRITSNCQKTSPSESAIITYKLTGGNAPKKYSVTKEFNAHGKVDFIAKFKFE